MNINLSRAVWTALSLAAATSGVAEAATAVMAATVRPAAVITGSYVDITSVPSTNVVYIGGSTAIDAALKYWAFNTGDTSVLCQSGTATVYTSTVTPKFTAVACSASGATGLTGISAGTLVAYIKEDGAGSLNGVAAVQNATFSGSPYTTGGALKFPDITAMTTSACTGATKSGTGLQTYYNATCGAVTVVQIVPMMGYSDVEGSLFGIDTNANVGSTGLPLLSGPTVQIPFGVAVNTGLYRALQTVQGLTTNDAVANMPSLTRTEVSALLSNKGNFWDQYKNTSGAAVSAQSVVFGSASGKCWNGTATTTVVPCSAATPAAPDVFICRRGLNSGSEKAAEIYFNDYNCGFNTVPFANYTDNATTAVATGCGATVGTDGCSWSTSYATTNSQVFPGNGTGDLLDCLVGHDQAGQLAIGFAAVDNLSGGDNSKSTRQDWRYIRLDGVVPSIENTAAGKYPFIAQAFWYATPTTATWSATAAGANAATLVTYLTSSTQGVGSKGSVVGVNKASVMATQGFDGGVLVIPSATNLPLTNTSVAADFAASPVSSVTKATTATNNCIRPQLYNQTTNSSVTNGNYSWAGPN